jgi:hypothetical protein
MADETVLVPKVVDLTKAEAEANLKDARLTVGTVNTVNSATTPVDSVISANPAEGTRVPVGSQVNLEVSSGPAKVAVPGPAPSAAPGPAPVKVPDVGGLTQSAAQRMLQDAGLVIGVVKKHYSDSVPVGGVSGTNPDAGTPVNPGANVDLDVSNGPERWWTAWIIPGFFFVFAIIVLLLIGYIVTPYGQKFLTDLAKKEVARGLITFLIAVTTVGIAIILAISTLVLTEGDAGDKRFDRGKQVLAVLIGVLGTIVGFYFGSTPEGAPQTLAITTKALPDGTVNTAYTLTTLQTANGTPPLTWSVNPDLPADLKLAPATGTISGTPKTASSKAFKFTVTDSATPPAASAANLTLQIK